jgi:hypothetical protein
MTIKQNIKVLNFNGVNHESNKQLINNLEFSIANIEPRGAYHINLPDDLVGNIASLKQRLELYQNFMEQSKNYINEKELLGIEREELTELIFDFINEQNLSSTFYKFLEQRKDNVRCLDIEYMMLDYMDEN